MHLRRSNTLRDFEKASEERAKALFELHLAKMHFEKAAARSYRLTQKLNRMVNAPTRKDVEEEKKVQEQITAMRRRIAEALGTQMDDLTDMKRLEAKFKQADDRYEIAMGMHREREFMALESEVDSD